jgi:hypothetical protein
MSTDVSVGEDETVVTFGHPLSRAEEALGQAMWHLSRGQQALYEWWIAEAQSIASGAVPGKGK